MYRVAVAAVVVCGVIGIGASLAGSYYKLESGALALSAAEVTNVSGAYTTAAFNLALDSQRVNKVADQVTLVQNTCEMVAMLIVVSSYFVVVPVCIVTLHRVKAVLLNFRRRPQAASPMMANLNSSTQEHEIIDRALLAAEAQRKTLLAVCAIVFFLILPRATYAVFQAVGNAQTELNRSCRLGPVVAVVGEYSSWFCCLPLCFWFCLGSAPHCLEFNPHSLGSICDSCQSVFLHINLWLRYSPQFRNICVLISSPLLLPVCLWFMMSSSQRLLLANAGDV
jgi:hypothetical protein